MKHLVKVLLALATVIIPSHLLSHDLRDTGFHNHDSGGEYFVVSASSAGLLRSSDPGLLAGPDSSTGPDSSADPDPSVHPDSAAGPDSSVSPDSVAGSDSFAHTDSSDGTKDSGDNLHNNRPGTSASPDSAAGTDSSAGSANSGRYPYGRNAVYAEILGSTMNLMSANYERALRDDLHIRGGAAWFGFSTQLRYEERGKDVHVALWTLPVSVSKTLFGEKRQLEIGAGFTFMSFTFSGGPFDVGYFDIELDNRYLGLAATSTIAYRVNVEEFIFRIGVSPNYLVSLDHDVTGSLDELEALDVLDFTSILNFQGFSLFPGLSFGRRF